jgi:hypothetical protein
MDLQTALDLLHDHYTDAVERHPETKSLTEWMRHLAARINDLNHAASETTIADHKLVAGKRALQVAVMALRLASDLDLGLVPHSYEVGSLNHTEI